MSETSEGRDRERRSVAARVMRALRHEWARAVLTPAPDTGEYRILVALEDDKVSEIVERGREHGSVYNVIVASATGDRLWPITVEAVEAPVSVTDPSMCPIQEDVEIGMLLAYLRTQRAGAAVPCRVGAVEIHDHPEPILVPA